MSEHTINNDNVNTDDSTDTDDEEKKMPARINTSHDNTPNDTSDTGDNDDEEGDMTIIRQEKNTYIIYEPTFRKEWMDKAYNGKVDY